MAGTLQDAVPCSCTLCVLIPARGWMRQRCHPQLLPSYRLELNLSVFPSLRCLVLKSPFYLSVQLYVTTVLVILVQLSRRCRSGVLEAKTRRVSKGRRLALGQCQPSGRGRDPRLLEAWSQAEVLYTKRSKNIEQKEWNWTRSWRPSEVGRLYIYILPAQERNLKAEWALQPRQMRPDQSNTTKGTRNICTSAYRHYKGAISWASLHTPLAASCLFFSVNCVRILLCF